MSEVAETMIVRAVELSDAVAWDALFRDYIAFYKATVADGVIATTWQRLVAGSDNMHGLVAVNADGSVIGLAHLVFHRSTWSPTWYCYLEDLYVDETMRGSGAGRALIAAAYGEADKRGATRTYWATQTENSVARRLYDDVGELTEFVQYRRPEAR
ncbi:MAG: GNAT family N-acetyltransferase [Hyphomicrobium sp.]|nr:MAG: GNAT family N-acetyltransferase [Hyphomicrobium sp.]PPD01790.1 MAG: GNAT family N-acetyltransferase [Hyphomicrobium sp.]